MLWIEEVVPSQRLAMLREAAIVVQTPELHIQAGVALAARHLVSTRPHTGSTTPADLQNTPCRRSAERPRSSPPAQLTAQSSFSLVCVCVCV